MTKHVAGMMVVTVVAVVLVCGVSAAGLFGTRTQMSDASVMPIAGMMPEVVSTAEAPRLVMPTVEVHAFRNLAASEAALDVY